MLLVNESVPSTLLKFLGLMTYTHQCAKYEIRKATQNYISRCMNYVHIASV